MQRISNFFQSKSFQGVITGLAIFLIFLLVFKAGMIVGSKKAEFSGNWSENYHRNFAGPKEGFVETLKDKNFMEANGAFGQVIKIENSAAIVKGPDNIEKSILMEEGKTSVKRFKENLKISDLKTADFIVVIGEPNEAGQIEAKLIRIMPSPVNRNNPKNMPRPMPYYQ